MGGTIRFLQTRHMHFKHLISIFTLPLNHNFNHIPVFCLLCFIALICFLTKYSNGVISIQNRSRLRIAKANHISYLYCSYAMAHSTLFIFYIHHICLRLSLSLSLYFFHIPLVFPNNFVVLHQSVCMFAVCFLNVARSVNRFANNIIFYNRQ